MRPAHEAHGLGLAGAALAAHVAAVEGLGLGPGLVHVRLGRDLHRLRLVARGFEHRGDHAGVGVAALVQRGEQRVEHMRHLAEEFARHGHGLGGGEFQHHAQVVGQLTLLHFQARLFVSLRQVD